MQDNTILGWINGKVIAEAEDGTFYWGEMPEEFVVPGEAADLSHLTPVMELPESERSAILGKFSGR